MREGSHSACMSRENQAQHKKFHPDGGHNATETGQRTLRNQKTDQRSPRLPLIVLANQ